MKTLKNKLLVALFAAFMITLGAAIIPTVGMQVKAAETDSFQITLTDGIAVKYYTTLAESVTEATATFTSETEALNATVKGEKSGDKWVFCYNEVTPQYIDATFSVAVNGETAVENYSVLTYLNTIINGEYAQEEKTVAKDLVYYGQAAKAFKLGGEVTVEPGTAYAGEDGMKLEGNYTADTRIYSVTVVFDTLPAIRFGFKKASATATIAVDGKDVTNELVAGEDGVYTYTLTGIYAAEFDKQYTVVLTDGENKQTLEYSINDYAARMQNGTDEAMKTLAQSLYCYGAGAKALKTYQETYVVVTEPTYTEPGVAKNGKGETVELPVLNNTNYNFTQKTKDGNDYKIIRDSQGNVTYSDYANGTLGTAYFTHKEHSEIVIEKEITADTITFNWTDYNNVDINFRATPDGMSAKYVDGIYVFTLTKDIEIPNFSKLSSVYPSVKMMGDGNVLNLSVNSSLNNLTIDGVDFVSTSNLSVQSLIIIESETASWKANTVSAQNFVMNGKSFVLEGNLSVSSLTIKNENNFTVTGTVSTTDLTMEGAGVLSITGKATFTNLTVGNESTLNFTAVGGDDFVLRENAVAKLYGTVNIVGASGKTGVTGNKNVNIYLSDTTRFTITNVSCSIGYFTGSVAEITVYYPSTATSNDYNKITSADGDVLFTAAGWIKNVAFVKQTEEN